MKVCALAWNASGNILAVGCNQSHTNWCYHTGVVNLYRCDRYIHFYLLKGYLAKLFFIRMFYIMVVKKICLGLSFSKTC